MSIRRKHENLADYLLYVSQGEFEYSDVQK